MNSTHTYDTSWTVELVQAVADRADSLTEATQYLQAATALVNVAQQEWQSRQDEQRRGHLMNDVYRASSQLGIASHELRNLKAMTTSQLEAYTEQLYRQLKSGSIKRLSAA